MSEYKKRRIEYRLEGTNFAAIRFIFECGYKLKTSPFIIASACRIFHRFFEQVRNHYDKYLIGATCLYMSGKILDGNFRIRDVVNVAHHTIHRGSEPLDLKDEYWNRRDAVIQAEFLINRMLNFKTKQDQPHRYMFHYLQTLQNYLSKKTWESVPLAQASLAFLQDFHHSSEIIKFKNEHVALACIHLAIQCYGIVIPCVVETDNKAWFSYLSRDINVNIIWKIVDAIIDVYNNKLINIHKME